MILNLLRQAGFLHCRAQIFGMLLHYPGKRKLFLLLQIVQQHSQWVHMDLQHFKRWLRSRLNRPTWSCSVLPRTGLVFGPRAAVWPHLPLSAHLLTFQTATYPSPTLECLLPSLPHRPLRWLSSAGLYLPLYAAVETGSALRSLAYLHAPGHLFPNKVQT